MPKVDGLEVLRMIKSDERLKNVPVVMLTSSREHQDLAESYRLGVNAYVVKPVDFSAFVDAVSKVGAVSGFIKDEQAIELEDGEQIRFLQKPYPAEKLLTLLAEILGKS